MMEADDTRAAHLETATRWGMATPELTVLDLQRGEAASGDEAASPQHAPGPSAA